jgi:hypothetical protein
MLRSQWSPAARNRPKRSRRRVYVPRTDVASLFAHGDSRAVVVPLDDATDDTAAQFWCRVVHRLRGHGPCHDLEAVAATRGAIVQRVAGTRGEVTTPAN